MVNLKKGGASKKANLGRVCIDKKDVKLEGQPSKKKMVEKSSSSLFTS
jgi:hypothetical protein